MLAFFRKIRKGLLGSGQVRKYLLYAVGEILLVMIGILLALQVNNWNEQKIIDQIEIDLIQSLVLELEQNARLLNTDYQKNVSYEKAYHKFLFEDSNSLSLPEKGELLRNAAGWAAADISTSVLKDVIGFKEGQLVRNTRLINQLRDLDHWCNGVLKHQSYLADFYNLELKGYLSKNHYAVWWANPDKYMDEDLIKRLFNDEEYKGYISMFDTTRRVVIGKQGEALKSIEQSLGIIEALSEM